MKHCVLVFVIFGIVAVLLSGCVGADAGPGSTFTGETCVPAGYTYIDYTDDSGSAPQDGIFRIDRVIWGPLSIYISGSAEGLPDSTRLSVQLYRNGEELDWLSSPRQDELSVQDGKWEIEIKAGYEEIPGELPVPDETYTLQIQRVFESSVTAELAIFPPGSQFVQYESGAGNSTDSLDGSSWRLVSLAGDELLEDTEITLDFERDRLSGRSGCNYYGGSYTTTDAGLFSLYDATITLLGCPQPILDQEQAYLNFLVNAVCYRIEGNQLEFYDVFSKKLTLVFEKIL
ncbi:MAG: META domain-containing protein [Dehalococcoidales bacterium]|nr:META domain-containing protein [Dehalococcoidales bacterium]